MLPPSGSSAKDQVLRRQTTSCIAETRSWADPDQPMHTRTVPNLWTSCLQPRRIGYLRKRSPPRPSSTLDLPNPRPPESTVKMSHGHAGLTPSTLPTSEGSTLPRTLQRFELSWAESTFRKHVGSSWDQPAPLNSTAKCPETLSALLPEVRRWDASLPLDLPTASEIDTPTPEHPVNFPWAAGAFPTTGVQWAALLAWRVWPLGDRATLDLLRKACSEAAELCMLAPWVSVRGAGHGIEEGETGPLAKVFLWAGGGPREPAR